MSSRRNGKGPDENVVPFRRPPPPRPPMNWRHPLQMFAGLFLAALVIGTLLDSRGGWIEHLLFAFLFASILAAADFVRLRRRIV